MCSDPTSRATCRHTCCTPSAQSCASKRRKSIFRSPRRASYPARCSYGNVLRKSGNGRNPGVTSDTRTLIDPSVFPWRRMIRVRMMIWRKLMKPSKIPPRNTMLRLQVSKKDKLIGKAKCLFSRRGWIFFFCDPRAVPHGSTAGDLSSLFHSHFVAGTPHFGESSSRKPLLTCCECALYFRVLSCTYTPGGEDDNLPDKNREGVHEDKTCGLCGETKGWSIPSGWTVVPKPSGAQGWTTDTLLAEQQHARAKAQFRYVMYRFRCVVYVVGVYGWDCFLYLGNYHHGCRAAVEQSWKL